MYGMSKHLKNRYKSNHKRKGGEMNKDRELERILWDYHKKIQDRENYATDNKSLTVDEIRIKAISQIKALYKPLGKEELLKILTGKVIVGEGITEQLTVSTRTLGLFADAIINARSKNEQR